MKTHTFDAISFLAGLVITGIGLTFLLLPELGSIVDFFTDAGAWFWPVAFLAVGIAILAPILGRPTRHDDESTQDNGEG